MSRQPRTPDAALIRWWHVLLGAALYAGGALWLLWMLGLLLTLAGAPR